MKIKYSGNTTNMRAHLTRHHPELALAEDANAKQALSKNQLTLDTLSLTKLPPNSEQAKKMTQAIAFFMFKDLCSYNVVVNEGFCHLLKTL